MTRRWNAALSEMQPWQIANTTVRNPYRLKDGLRILSASSLIGDLVGRDREQSFAELLHETKVVFVRRIGSGKHGDSSDVGRKWRSALDKLGFISPKLSKKVDAQGIDIAVKEIGKSITTLKGKPYELTPQGQRLVNAETLAEEQECFLRALVAYQLTPAELSSKEAFNPLRVVLRVIDELGRKGDEPSISFEEMASVVQFVTSEAETAKAADAVIDYRKKRAHADNKKAFDRKFRSSHTKTSNQTKLQTFGDYADTNLRYLKATSLFSLKGRGIMLADRKKPLASKLLSTPFIPKELKDYYPILWNGAPLPTDDRQEAIAAIKSLAQALRDKGIAVSLPDLDGLTIQDLSQRRFRLEDQEKRLQEEEFAAKQRREWEEIFAFMEELAGVKISQKRVPQAEAPAYLEWTTWRAFLAINSLVNKPSDARRFQIDQDFLPVRTAPGNGPDMVFEFDNFVLVVEVTLTSSSRQEAAEGEPVRRHVAKFVEGFESKGKDVYGLFVANTIDSNTAETFRLGSWYKQDDTRLALRIVPLTLRQFAGLFRAGFGSSSGLTPYDVERTLRDCLVERAAEAPVWKRLIDREIKRACDRLEERQLRR